MAFGAIRFSRGATGAGLDFGSIRSWRVPLCVASSDNMADAFSKEFSELCSIGSICRIEDVRLLLVVDKGDQIPKVRKEYVSPKGCDLLSEY